MSREEGVPRHWRQWVQGTRSRMDRQRWQQVRKALGRALDLESPQREEYLGGLEPVLAGEVRDLLEADEEAGEFLEQPETGWQPGAGVGEYVIEAMVARGGMGEVYRAAERQDPKRRVAIKVLGPVFLLRDAERQFERERRILGQLSHPNIVKMLGSGEHEGRQYLVMEWVDGLSVDEWAKTAGMERRLLLFERVCAAVQAAHQSLIVHRDLKPSNILVTAEGQPKLLDFGIARLLDLSGEMAASTRSALQVMSLPYCSPEQARNLPAGIPSDIYSLGLILYELATGRRAQDVSSLPLDEAIRRIVEEEPPAAREAGEDLAAIIGKASAKEPHRRYASALELGEDVRRHREGYGVLARPATLRYTILKLVRRHRAAVLAAGVGVVIALAGLAGFGMQYYRTQKQKEAAERRFAAVRQMAQVMLFDAPRRMEGIPGTIEARRWMLERALAYLEQLAADVRGDAGLALTVAGGYRQVAFQQFNLNAPNLNDREGSLRSLERGMAVLRTVKEPDAENLREQVENLLARPYGALGRQVEARENEDQAFGLARRLEAKRGRRDEDLLIRIRFQSALNFSRSESERLGLWKEIEEYYAGRLRESPNDPGRLRNLALAHKNASGVYAFGKRWDEALKHDRLALELDAKRLRLVQDDGGARMDYSFSLGRLGQDLCLAGRRKEGLPLLRQAVQIRREMVVREPEDRRAQERLAWMLGELGQHLMWDGSWAEAEERIREALNYRERLNAPGLGENSTSELHRMLADLAERRGQPGHACREWEIAARMLPEDHSGASWEVIGADEIKARARACASERGRRG